MSGLIRPSIFLDSMLQRIGVNWRALGLGNILVALPLIHIAISTLFLFGYCVGFGSHLARFVRPEDIFSVSISEVVAIYMVTTGQLAAFGALNRWKPKSDRYAKPFGPPTRYHFPFWIRQSATILAIGTVTLTLVNFSIGEPVSPTLVAMVVALQAVVYADRTEAGQRDLFVKLLAFSVLIPVLMGASSGQDDRHNLRQNDGALLKCGAHQVYRPIGGLLLSRVGEAHVLLNEECKPVLTIPEIKPMVPRETTEAIQTDLKRRVAKLFSLPSHPVQRSQPSDPPPSQA